MSQIITISAKLLLPLVNYGNMAIEITEQRTAGEGEDFEIVKKECDKSVREQVIKSAKFYATNFLASVIRTKVAGLPMRSEEAIKAAMIEEMVASSVTRIAMTTGLTANELIDTLWSRLADLVTSDTEKAREESHDGQ